MAQFLCFASAGAYTPPHLLLLTTASPFKFKIIDRSLSVIKLQVLTVTGCKSCRLVPSVAVVTVWLKTIILLSTVHVLTVVYIATHCQSTTLQLTKLSLAAVLRKNAV